MSYEQYRKRIDRTQLIAEIAILADTLVRWVAVHARSIDHMRNNEVYLTLEEKLKELEKLAP